MVERTDGESVLQKRELVGKRGVVRYEGILPEASLIAIDGEKLSEVLARWGFGDWNIVVDSRHHIKQERGGFTLGWCNFLQKEVYLYEHPWRRYVQHAYSGCLQDIGGERSTLRHTKFSKLTKSLTNSWQVISNVGGWPYMIIEQSPDHPFFMGDKKRKGKYFREARFAPAERKDRAIHYLEKLIAIVLERELKATLAHELEHGKGIGRKFAACVAVTTAPLLIELGLMSLIGRQDFVLHHLTDLEREIVPRFAAGMSSILSLLTLGRVALEKDSMEQERSKKRLAESAGAIGVNWDVFQKEIFTNSQTN